MAKARVNLNRRFESYPNEMPLTQCLLLAVGGTDFCQHSLININEEIEKSQL